MTIRNRLTFWYAGALLFTILVMGGVLYYELVYEARKVAAAGKPKEPMEEEISEVLLFYGAPTTLITVLGGWWLLRRSLAPLERLTHAAERINEDNLSEQLPRTGTGDEVDQLSEALNATTRRLDNSFMRIREFTLHASHELKTPLTVIRSGLETTLNTEAISTGERERTLSLLEEIDRLTHIVDSLTLLTKADAGQITLEKKPVALGELVKEAYEDASALAQAHGIEVSWGEFASVNVMGDRRRLRQLLLILTDNAIKYNRPQGQVILSLRADNQFATVSVVNTGAGLSPALVERVFDRFFRGDDNLNKDIEGCGLGLTIAKWIVEAHQGKIQFASEVNGLTTVTVKLPLTAETVS